MFGKISAIFITLMVLEENVSGDGYNRKYLQKKYPGFGTDWIPMGKDENGYIIGYITEPIGPRFPFEDIKEPKDAVEFTLFTRSNSEIGINITTSFNIIDKILDKTKLTKFIIHGWLAKGTNPDPVAIKDGFLKKYDANVFIVDWNKISKRGYALVVPHVSEVGEYVATFINHIITLGVDPKNIQLIGHSLGAHVAGAAARNAKPSKLARVTGLDPANPGFGGRFLSAATLSQNDANFVDVIHTCAGYLGLSSPLGHADFYPNGGGPPQPNCAITKELTEACSHGESWVFYSESLKSHVKFTARRCDSWKMFKNDRENCHNELIPMGDPAPVTARGENGPSDKYSRESLQKKYPGFGKDWLPMGKDENGYIIGYLKEPKGLRFSSDILEPKDAVEFTLFTRSNSKTGISGINSTTFIIVDKILDKTKPTKFIIHGWMAKGTNRNPVAIKDGFLKKYDANVFIVDWSKIAKNIVYPAVLPAIKPVGEFIATFINHIISLGVDSKNIQLVGHSLGAHVAGTAGRNVKNSKLARITGLDPASPGFEVKVFPTEPLGKNDADFVDVIHTCAGYLGYPEDLGHADFYPNSGKPPQPNCHSVSKELMEACSHRESWKFYLLSLKSTVKFEAYQCSSWEDYESNFKNFQNNPVLMGDPVPVTARGQFYLRTADVPIAAGDDFAAN